MFLILLSCVIVLVYILAIIGSFQGAKSTSSMRKSFHFVKLPFDGLTLRTRNKQNLDFYFSSEYSCQATPLKPLLVIFCMSDREGQPCLG